MARLPLLLSWSLLLLPLAPLVGCGQDLDWPDDRIWQSAHFRYHTRAAEDVACEGVTAQLERHFQLVQDFLGFPWLAGDKVDYFKFHDQADFARAALCPAPSVGCAGGRGVRTAEVLSHHELIHAYLGPLGLPPPFFEEGVAAALSCERLAAVSARPWRDVITLGPYDDDQRIYREGPWFVGYLLYRFGPAPFLALYAALPGTATADDVAARFAAVYPLTLDQAWEDARAAGRATRCVFLWECAGPPFPADGTPAPLGRACDGGDRFRTFQIPDGGADALVNRGGYLAYSPVTCDEVPARLVGADVDTFTSVAHFEAGRYFFPASDVPVEIGVRVSPVKLLSPTCGDGDAEPLAPNDRELRDDRFELTVPNDGRPWFVKLRPPPWMSFPFAQAGARGDAWVDQCSSCGDEAACADLSVVPAPEDPGLITLRITPHDSSDDHVDVPFFWGH